MQKSTWKLLASLLLLMAMVGFAAAALAQESPTAAAAQAQAAPYNPAAAAFATLPPKPPSSSSSEGPDPDRKWEIEFHGGGTFSTNPTGGSHALPGPGATFTTVGATQSRAISSYYFGDGALLFNQFQVSGPSCPGCTPIVPLDGVLIFPTAERSNSGAFGFRVSRDISPRWAIEANFDYNLGQMEITTPGLAGIEATRASYATGWTNFFAAFPAFSGVTVSSTKTLKPEEGHQIFGTAGVNINLMTQGRVIPYVSFGGGVLANTGDAPSVLLVGNAQFNLGGGTIPHHQTDTVLVQWGPGDLQGVGYFGGGFKYYVTPRWGIRLDVRDYLSGNQLQQVVSATPVVATLTPAQAVCRCQPTNDLQFSNNPPSGQDTLSGPAINRFRTFSGDGIRNQIAVSGGVFFRF